MMLRSITSLFPRGHHHTKADHQVPLIFRENHLLSGYRLPYKPWSYYVKSLFFLHNESGNVWSHLIALCIFIYKVFDVAPDVDYWREPLSWPILGFILGIITYALLSTTAHLFQSKSPLIHYLCFQIDYIGIGMNGYGNGVIVYYLTGSKAYYRLLPPAVFMSLNVLIAIYSCIGCTVAKLKYSRPYPMERKFWQIGSVGFHSFFGGLPYLCFLFNCLFYEDQCPLEDHLPELQIFILFALATFFYATHLPERLAPGRFDIVGHGHQLFHVFMIFTSLTQIKGGLIRMRTRSPELAAMAPPSFVFIFGGIAVVITAAIIFILSTHKYRMEKVRTDALREKSAEPVSNGHGEVSNGTSVLTTSSYSNNSNGWHSEETSGTSIMNGHGAISGSANDMKVTKSRSGKSY